MSSSIGFIAWDLTFGSLTHFVLIVLCDMK
jgi:hypothetical protein